MHLRGLVAVTALVVACGESEAEPPRLEIIVDDLGIPHVYGATDEDAFYGAGYQMAVARLYHMDMTRRGAYGRQAEVLGTDRVEDDRLARTFDWAGWGLRHAERMAMENPETLALIDAWTRGVNARVDEVLGGDAPLPYGFGPDEHDFVPERWAAHDVLVIATMTGFGNDLSFDREIFTTIAYRLAPDALEAVEILRPIRPIAITPIATHVQAPSPPRREARALADVDRDALSRTLAALHRLRGLQGLGSNNWVVSGEHTHDGRPLIAGDPHLNFDVPGLFYAQHINSKDQGGTIDAAGFSFVGTPGISVGQTDRIVWTPTTAFADVMDVWTVAMPDEGHASIGGELVEVVRRTEVITVRGQDTTESLEVLDVPGHGVLLPEDLIPLPLGEPGDRLLLGWTGFSPNAFHGLLDFNRAQTIDEFDEAVLGWNGNFNFVAADAEGITYRVGTKVPVRDIADGRTPHLVQDADDAKTLWTDARLPPEQLPHSRGEGRGYVSTANNDPFGFLADGRIDGDPWYFGAFFDPGWRAARIDAELQRLVGRGAIGLEDMQALQTDVHDSIADDLVALVVDAWAHRDDDPALADLAARTELGTLVDLLESWDRDMRRDSAAALVMHAWSYFVARRTLEDDMPLLFLQALEMQPSFMIKIAVMAVHGDYAMGDAVVQEGRDAVLLLALADVADLLLARFGTVDPAAYRLSDVRFTDLDGAHGVGLDPGRVATDGGTSTIDVAADSTFFDASGGVLEQWVSPHGPIFRMTGRFAEDGTPELFFAFALGNVADPQSPHSHDLHDAWIEGRYHPMRFRRAEIEAAAEERYTLLGGDDE